MDFRIGHPSVLPQGREVMGEKCVEDLDQLVYRLLRTMLQGSVRYTVWSRSLTDLETLDGFANLIRVGKLGSLAGV